MIELSVVIPTYNKKKTLQMTLQALNCQDYDFDKFEVIIVDDGSTDGTIKEIKNLIPKLKFKTSILSQTNQGPASARNRGIKKARGKIVLIINNDTIATSDLVKRHFEFHQKHPDEKFGLLGYVTWHPDLRVTPFMYWLEHGGPYFSFSEIKGRKAGWERFWTCNISLKKKFLLENGLLNEEFPYAAWEDIELGYRLGKAGLQLLYDKHAVGYHYHPTTIDSIKNKMKANGESAMILKKKLPKNLLPPLAKFPRLAIILDTIFFFKPSFFLLEKIALWAETRINLGLIFDLLLLHWRIEGLREWYNISQ